MRYTDLFGKTKRDAPAEMTDATLRLAFRAGLLRAVNTGQPTNGQWLYLPLASNVISQMFMMLRGDLDEMNAQELRGVPSVALDALAAAEIQSYKQMPARVYWHSGGMTRLQLASYEVTRDAALETHAQFEKLARDLFEYAGVTWQTAQDVNDARVWYTDAPALDLEIFRSRTGPYAATRAAAAPSKPPAPAEALLPLQEVETPHCDTIEALANWLNVPTSRTAKAVFYSAEGRVIFAVIRGDLQIDEAKVKRALGVSTLRWATDDEIARVGATPGFASPIGARGATIVVDDSILHSPNLVAGANKANYHLLNTNVPRDYKPDVVTDLALARVGDASPDGSGTLELVRGVALGRLAALRELNASFLDANGKAQKPYAVTMELDLGAILLAHLGAHHDDKGIVWTRALAPFDVHIVALNADKPEVAPVLTQVVDALELAGLDVLVDDRNESAGVKFNDADLIGLPLRITLGPKTVAQNAVEFKTRGDAVARLVSIDAWNQEIEQWMDS
jgi:prolyl-tRNA synthetase